MTYWWKNFRGKKILSDLSSTEKYLRQLIILYLLKIAFTINLKNVFKKDRTYFKKYTVNRYMMKSLSASPEMCHFVTAIDFLLSRKPRHEPLKDPGSTSLPYNPSCLINLNIIYINCWTLTLPPIKFSKIHVKVKITNYKTRKLISYLKHTLPIISW